MCTLFEPMCIMWSRMWSLLFSIPKSLPSLVKSGQVLARPWNATQKKIFLLSFIVAVERIWLTILLRQGPQLLDLYTAVRSATTALHS